MSDAKSPSERSFYTVQEVADRFGTCKDEVYRLLKRGLLKASPAWRTKRIFRASVEEFESVEAEMNKGSR